MTQEKMMEMMQRQDFKEAMQALMQKNHEDQKQSTLQKYRMLNQYAKKGQTLFVGSSLMEFFPIHEMQISLGLDHCIYNRGIGGTTTTDLLASMDTCIFDLEPSKMFINIGSNDIGSPEDYAKETFINNYDAIMEQIKRRLPRCDVFVMAYYPVNAEADFGLDASVKATMFATRTNANIAEANIAIEALAKKHGFHFINVNNGLMDEKGNLKKEFSIEGLHMWPNAYAVVLSNLIQYL
jgi:lysophospholipase L1-like esterase